MYCPDEAVSFTCTDTALFRYGSFIFWKIFPQQGPSIFLINDSLEPFYQESIFQAVLTNASEGMINSTLTLETMASTVDGSRVTCQGESSITISFVIPVVRKLLITIKIYLHLLTDPPSPPLTLMVSSQQNGVDSSLLTLTWSPPSSNGGMSVSYTLTISPLPLSGSPATMEINFIQITVSYNTLYNVTIRAVNCAGMSDGSTITIAPIG